MQRRVEVIDAIRSVAVELTPTERRVLITGDASAEQRGEMVALLVTRVRLLAARAAGDVMVRDGDGV